MRFCFRIWLLSHGPSPWWLSDPHPLFLLGQKKLPLTAQLCVLDLGLWVWVSCSKVLQHITEIKMEAARTVWNAGCCFSTKVFFSHHPQISQNPPLCQVQAELRARKATINVSSFDCRGFLYSIYSGSKATFCQRYDITPDHRTAFLTQASFKWNEAVCCHRF